MKLLLMLCALAPLFAVAYPAEGQTGPGAAPQTGGLPPAMPSYRPVELALVSPVHLFHPERKVITGLSLVVLYGRADGLRGIEVGAIANHHKGNVMGLEIAGILSKVDARVMGIAVAGVTNVHLECFGLCLAGVLNYEARGGAGLRLAAVNLGGSEGRFSGLDVSAVSGGKAMSGLSLSTTSVFDDVTGVQIGLAMNVAFQRLRGLQIGLFYNSNNVLFSYSGGSFKVSTYDGAENAGVQIAPVANFTQGHTAGAQIGALNVAERMTGVQIGLINIATALRGVQIGVINIAVDNRLPFMLGVLPGVPKSPSEMPRPPAP